MTLKRNKPEENMATYALETENIASATECTGLVPAAVQTPEEGEDYARLYAIHNQKTAWKREK